MCVKGTFRHATGTKKAYINKTRAARKENVYFIHNKEIIKALNILIEIHIHIKRLHLLESLLVFAQGACMSIIVVVLVVRVRPELVRMTSSAGLVKQAAPHVHAQLLHLLVVLLALGDDLLLLPELQLLLDLLHAAPHLNRALLHLRLQVELHLAPAHIMRVLLVDELKRRLSLVQVAIFEQIVVHGLRLGDETVRPLGVLALVANEAVEGVEEPGLGELTMAVRASWPITLENWRFFLCWYYLFWFFFGFLQQETAAGVFVLRTSDLYAGFVDRDHFSFRVGVAQKAALLQYHRSLPISFYAIQLTFC